VCHRVGRVAVRDPGKRLFRAGQTAVQFLDFGLLGGFALTTRPTRPLPAPAVPLKVPTSAVVIVVVIVVIVFVVFVPTSICVVVIAVVTPGIGVVIVFVAVLRALIRLLVALLAVRKGETLHSRNIDLVGGQGAATDLQIVLVFVPFRHILLRQ
jgi:hypothetical protein